MNTGYLCFSTCLHFTLCSQGGIPHIVSTWHITCTLQQERSLYLRRAIWYGANQFQTGRCFTDFQFTSTRTDTVSWDYMLQEQQSGQIWLHYSNVVTMFCFTFTLIRQTPKYASDSITNSSPHGDVLATSPTETSPNSVPCYCQHQSARIANGYSTNPINPFFFLSAFFHIPRFIN